MQMLRIGPPRAPKGHEDQLPVDPEASAQRQVEAAEREDARRRVAALDLRVDVLTGRLRRHEQRKHH